MTALPVGPAMPTGSYTTVENCTRKPSLTVVTAYCDSNVTSAGQLRSPTFCDAMQAVMAAAKQQHQQHIADIESHLQEATEATQHAQASEAEVKLTAESLSKAVKADQAAATAAAKQTEAALQLLKKTLAAAAHDRAATTQQHTEKLRGFILSTVHQATSGWQDVSETARDARALLEGVSKEIHAGMQTASQLLEERLRRVEAAVASGSQNQTNRTSGGPIQLGQVTVPPSIHTATGICDSILLHPRHNKKLSRYHYTSAPYDC